jgi:hypothetical protein
MWSGVLGVGLCALAAAGRPAAVVITSERSGAAPYASAIAKTVEQELRNAGAAMISDAAVQEHLAGLKPKGCNGNAACVSKLAAALGDQSVLVSVDVGKLGSRLTIHLEAISASGQSLESVNLGAAANAWQLDLSGPISLFAQALAQKLQPPPAAAPPTAVAPVAPPPPTQPPPAAVEKPTPWAAWALLALGVGAAGTTIGFGIDGLSAKSAYDNSFLTGGMPYLGPDGHPASHLTQPQLDSLRNQGNTSFTIALATGVVGVALLALAVWLFVSD